MVKKNLTLLKEKFENGFSSHINNLKEIIELQFNKAELIEIAKKLKNCKTNKEFKNITGLSKDQLIDKIIGTNAVEMFIKSIDDGCLNYDLYFDEGLTSGYFSIYVEKKGEYKNNSWNYTQEQMTSLIIAFLKWYDGRSIFMNLEDELDKLDISYDSHNGGWVFEFLDDCIGIRYMVLINLDSDKEDRFMLNVYVIMVNTLWALGTVSNKDWDDYGVGKETEYALENLTELFDYYQEYMGIHCSIERELNDHCKEYYNEFLSLV